jgi:hypothetical protein
VWQWRSEGASWSEDGAGIFKGMESTSVMTIGPFGQAQLSRIRTQGKWMKCFGKTERNTWKVACSVMTRKWKLVPKMGQLHTVFGDYIENRR